MDDDLRILVLGDEETPVDLIEFELSKLTLRFAAAPVTSWDGFFKSIQEASPNLILITDGFVGFGGLTAQTLAQAICPGVPCLIVSSTASQVDAPKNRKSQLARGSDFGPHLEPEVARWLAAAGITLLPHQMPEARPTEQDSLQLLQQVAGVIIAFLSPQGHIQELNWEAERLTGWRKHEILGEDSLALFFPEANRDAITGHLQRVLAGKSTASIDLPLKARNGSQHLFRWHCNLVSDRCGQPAGIMLVGQVIVGSMPVESLPRKRLARSLPRSIVFRARSGLTRRTGTC
jgi:PAS domain S-box-containing protein